MKLPKLTSFIFSYLVTFHHHLLWRYCRRGRERRWERDWAPGIERERGRWVSRERRCERDWVPGKDMERG